jgi:hypothetical protein
LHFPSWAHVLGSPRPPSDLMSSQQAPRPRQTAALTAMIYHSTRVPKQVSKGRGAGVKSGDQARASKGPTVVDSSCYQPNPGFSHSIPDGNHKEGVSIRSNQYHFSHSRDFCCRARVVTLVILATQEAEIRRIAV